MQGQIPVNPFEPLREIKPQANQFPHKCSLDAVAPFMEFPGGELRIVSQKEFPITTMTGATMLVNPGSVRELHWHPNADEWQFVLSGRARVTIFGAHARTKTAEFGQGEVGFVKQGFGHYIEQVGSEPLRMLFIFNSPVYEEINISTWLGANPVARRIASINDLPISESDRKFFWPLGRRPDEHPRSLGFRFITTSHNST